MTLADQCRAAAPPEMVATGWEWQSIGVAAADAVWGRGQDPAATLGVDVGDDTHGPWYLVHARVGGITRGSAEGPDLARALAYVYGELRREMVARGMVPPHAEDVATTGDARELAVLRAGLQALADGPCPSRDKPGTVAARLCPDCCTACLAREILRQGDDARGGDR